MTDHEHDHPISQVGLVLIAAATGLQVAWLGVILWTQAAPHPIRPIILIAYTFVATWMTLVFPSPLACALAAALRRLLRRERLFLVSLSVLVAVEGAVYALSPNNTFSDEDKVVRLANMIAEDGISAFFRNYRSFPWLGMQHPPLAILFYGLGSRVARLDVYGLRLMNVLLAVGVSLLTYRLGRALYDHATGALAAILLLATPYFARLSAVAMLDMSLAALFIFAVLVLTQLTNYDDREAGRWVHSLILGVAIGCGLLVKYEMVLIYPVLIAWTALHGRLRHVAGALAVAGCISLTMLAGWLVALWQLGALGQQFKQVALFATYATRNTTSTPWVFESLMTRLPSAFGLYHLPALALGLRQALTSRATRDDRSLLAAVALIVAPVTLMLPDPRYFFPAFPLLAIVMARGLSTLSASTLVRILLITCLHALGALVLFWGWERQTHIFLH
jgi:4-amino-4-deoxy-L-arabinose transferase-like glycosyltransferase